MQLITAVARHSGWFICGGVMALTVLCASGCSIIGAAVYKVVGPDAVPARYDLPQKPTLVLVENSQHTDGMEAPSDQLAEDIVQEITDHKVVPVIDIQKLYALRGADPKKYEAMKITEIGRALGAAQVLYVNLERCDLGYATGSDVIQGKVGVTVRVVDVGSGRTLWPPNSDGYPIHSEPSMARHTDTIADAAMRDSILGDVSKEVTTLFYASKPDYDTRDDVGD